MTEPQPAGEAARMADCGDYRFGPEESGPWYLWGPYLAERGWGTVREDYSADGDAWRYFPYDHARSRTFRWNEDGLLGICDLNQDMTLSLALWNGRDSHLKERFFGLDGWQGNHGEDVKEYWWYDDATPSHAWLRAHYHYPQSSFPYDELVTVNGSRTRQDAEYELLDTGAFDDDRYWVVDVAYAKSDPSDILMRIRVTNVGPDKDTLHVLPTMVFRDSWSWGKDRDVPQFAFDAGTIVVDHSRLGRYHLDAEVASDGTAPEAVFCDNRTNTQRLYGTPLDEPYPKDGINDHVVQGLPTVNPERQGTKSAWWYTLDVPAGETVELRLRLWSPSDGDHPHPGWAGDRFASLMALREREADEFYAALAPEGTSADARDVMRRAFAGMIWCKQFFRYDVSRWLDGDPDEPPPPPGHKHVRNMHWRNLDAYDVLSMPDSWEYPWFAAWDLAFHTVVFAHIDPEYSKYQLMLMLREWYLEYSGSMCAKTTVW
ncbi:MAG: glucosidase, partial [Actinomycetota bacterium]